MDRLSEWLQSAIEPLQGAAALLAAFIPRLLGAVLLLIIGWVIAALLRRLARRSLEGVGRFLRKLPGFDGVQEGRYSGIGAIVLSYVVFWGVLIVFAVFAAQLLALDIVTRGLNALLNYLPSFAIGVAIVLAGIILGALAYPVVAQSARTANLPQSELLGRVTQIAIIAAAAVVGATAIGLDVSFLANIAVVFLGVLVGAFALGLALGTPTHVSNVISARYVRRQFDEGDWILIDQHQGRISEIGPTYIVIESDDGDVIIPARLFVDKPCTKLVKHNHEGG